MQQILLQHLYAKNLSPIPRNQPQSYQQHLSYEQGKHQSAQAHSAVETAASYHHSSKNKLENFQNRQNVLSSIVTFQSSSQQDLNSLQCHIEQSPQLESMTMFYVPRSENRQKDLKKDQTQIQTNFTELAGSKSPQNKYQLVHLKFVFAQKGQQNKENVITESKDRKDVSNALSSKSKFSVRVQSGFRSFDDLKSNPEQVSFDKVITRQIVYQGAFHKSIASFAINRQIKKNLKFQIVSQAKILSNNQLNSDIFSSIKLQSKLSSPNQQNLALSGSPFAQLNLYSEIKAFKQAQYKLQKEKMQEEKKLRQKEEEEQKRKEHEQLIAKRKFQQQKAKIKKLVEMEQKKHQMLMDNRKDGSISRFFRKCACCQHPEDYAINHKNDLSRSRQQQRLSAKKGHQCFHRLFNLSIKYKNSRSKENGNSPLKRYQMSSSFEEDTKTVLKPKLRRAKLLQRLVNNKMDKQSERFQRENKTGNNSSYEMLLRRLKPKKSILKNCQHQNQNESGRLASQAKRCYCCSNKGQSDEVIKFQYLKAKKQKKSQNDNFTQSFYISKSIDRVQSSKHNQSKTNNIKTNLNQEGEDKNIGHQTHLLDNQFDFSERQTLSECDKEDFQYQFEKFNNQLQQSEINYEQSQTWNLTHKDNQVANVQEQILQSYHNGAQMQNGHSQIENTQKYPTNKYKKEKPIQSKEPTKMLQDNKKQTKQQSAHKSLHKQKTQNQINSLIQPQNEDTPIIHQDDPTLSKKLKSRDIISMSKQKATERKMKQNHMNQEREKQQIILNDVQKKQGRSIHQLLKIQQPKLQRLDFAQFDEEQLIQAIHPAKQVKKTLIQTKNDQRSPTKPNHIKSSEQKQVSKAKKENSTIQKNINNINSKSKSKLPKQTEVQNLKSTKKQQSRQQQLTKNSSKRLEQKNNPVKKVMKVEQISKFSEQVDYQNKQTLQKQSWLVTQTENSQIRQKQILNAYEIQQKSKNQITQNEILHNFVPLNEIAKKTSQQPDISITEFPMNVNDSKSTHSLSGHGFMNKESDSKKSQRNIEQKQVTKIETDKVFFEKNQAIQNQAICHENNQPNNICNDQQNYPDIVSSSNHRQQVKESNCKQDQNHNQDQSLAFQDIPDKNHSQFHAQMQEPMSSMETKQPQLGPKQQLKALQIVQEQKIVQFYRQDKSYGRIIISQRNDYRENVQQKLKQNTETIPINIFEKQNINILEKKIQIDQPHILKTNVSPQMTDQFKIDSAHRVQEEKSQNSNIIPLLNDPNNEKAIIQSEQTINRGSQISEISQPLQTKTSNELEQLKPSNIQNDRISSSFNNQTFLQSSEQQTQQALININQDLNSVKTIQPDGNLFEKLTDAQYQNKPIEQPKQLHLISQASQNNLVNQKQRQNKHQQQKSLQKFSSIQSEPKYPQNPSVNDNIPRKNQVSGQKEDQVANNPVKLRSSQDNSTKNNLSDNVIQNLQQIERHLKLNNAETKFQLQAQNDRPSQNNKILIQQASDDVDNLNAIKSNKDLIQIETKKIHTNSVEKQQIKQEISRKEIKNIEQLYIESNQKLYFSKNKQVTQQPQITSQNINGQRPKSQVLSKKTENLISLSEQTKKTETEILNQKNLIKQGQKVETAQIKSKNDSIQKMKLTVKEVKSVRNDQLQTKLHNIIEDVRNLNSECIKEKIQGEKQAETEVNHINETQSYQIPQKALEANYLHKSNKLSEKFLTPVNYSAQKTEVGIAEQPLKQPKLCLIQQKQQNLKIHQPYLQQTEKIAEQAIITNSQSQKTNSVSGLNHLLQRQKSITPEEQFGHRKNKSIEIQTQQFILQPYYQNHYDTSVQYSAIHLNRISMQSNRSSNSPDFIQSTMKQSTLSKQSFAKPQIHPVKPLDNSIQKKQKKLQVSNLPISISVNKSLSSASSNMNKQKSINNEQAGNTNQANHTQVLIDKQKSFQNCEQSSIQESHKVQDSSQKTDKNPKNEKISQIGQSGPQNKNLSELQPIKSSKQNEFRPINESISKEQSQNPFLKLQSLFKKQSLSSNIQKPQQSISQSLFDKLTPILKTSSKGNDHDDKAKQMSLQALFSKLNNFGKITEHPTILNQVIKSSDLSIEESIIVLDPKMSTKFEQKQFNAVKYAIRFINKHFGDKFIEENIFCTKNIELCLFIEQEWKIFSYKNFTHIKDLQVLASTENSAKINLKKQKLIETILSQVISINFCEQLKIDVISCIELFTGINSKKVKSKEHKLSVQDENKLAKKIKSFLSATHKETNQIVYTKENLVLKFDDAHLGLISDLETFKSASTFSKAQLSNNQTSRQKDNPKSSSKHKTQKKQHILAYSLIDQNIHHTELSTSSVFLTYLTPHIKFQTLQATVESVNTFELYLGNCMMIVADPNFRFILYKETAKDKYEIVKEGKGFVKYCAPQEKCAYLMIVEPIKDKKIKESEVKSQKNDNFTEEKSLKTMKNICIRYYFKQLAEEGLLDRLIQCLYSGKAQTKGGGYENQKNLYLPVQKEDAQMHSRKYV